jgi:hypothetical protein
MPTGTRVEVEHRDRGDIILELELADWIAWESWAGRSFVTFGDEKNPPGAKDVAYLGYEAAKRTGVHSGDFASWIKALVGWPQFRQGDLTGPTQPEASDEGA